MGALHAKWGGNFGHCDWASEAARIPVLHAKPGSKLGQIFQASAAPAWAYCMQIKVKFRQDFLGFSSWDELICAWGA